MGESDALGGRARLRVVVVSAVRHARDYTDALMVHPDYEVVGVAEDDTAGPPAVQAADLLARRHDLQRRRDTAPWGTIDTNDAADVAMICAEPTRHAVLARRWLDAGFDVLVDKPMATDLASALEVSAAAERSGRRCAVVTRVLTPALGRMRAWIADGQVGLPRSVDVEFLASGRDFAAAVERPELVTDPDLSGGGELMNFLGYPIDFIRHLTGCEPREVFAEAATSFSEVHRRHGVEDTAVLSLAFDHGLVASIVVGRVPVAPGVGPGTASIRLVGSHGHVEFDAEAPSVELFGADGAHARVRTGPTPIESVLDELVAARREDRRPAYDHRDALAAAATTEAAYRSIASGRSEAIARYDKTTSTTEESSPR